MSNSIRFTVLGVGLIGCAFAVAGVRSQPARGATTQAAPLEASPGRFQLQNINDTPYLLDTQTGRVWYDQRSVVIPSKNDEATITANGTTMHIPMPQNTWIDVSPAWAKP